VLANVMRKPMEAVFSEFAGRKPVKGGADGGDTYMGSGDVKYHLGTSYDRPTISGGGSVARGMQSVFVFCLFRVGLLGLIDLSPGVYVWAALVAGWQSHWLAGWQHPRLCSLPPPPACPPLPAAGKRIHLSLLANPSHLEAVNTVCMGKVGASYY
jgi:hypothetical protein